MKRLLVITSVMIITVGFILISCSDMKHTNLFDPAAGYYEPPVAPELTLSPTGPQNIDNMVYNGETIQFTAEGGTPPYRWELIPLSGMGPTPTISQNGLFTESPCGGAGMGTCKVKVTDLAGESVTSGLITFDQT